MSLIHRTGTSLSHPRRRHVAALASGLLLAGGLVAAAAPATAAVPVRVLDVTAHDSGNETPPSSDPQVSDWFTLSSDHLTAGLVDVRLHNAGSTDHQVQFVRVHDDVNVDAYLASVKASFGATALIGADAMGGSNAVAPGGFQETWVNLPAGNYVALCFLDGPSGSGPPHLATGMATTFTVTGRGNSAHPPGYVRGTIAAYTSVGTSGETLGFHMPAVIDGHGIYRFVNTAAADTHELTLIKLVSGATADMAKDWIEGKVPGPPPFADPASYGGSGALAPGGESWVRMNLEPGDYIAVCFVPDDASPHLPHAALGMVQGFHVDG